MNKIKYIVGIIATLLGSIVYLFIKKQSAEALLQNNEVKTKLNEQDKEKAKNDGLLASEEEKRNNLLASVKERKNNDVKPGDF